MLHKPDGVLEMKRPYTIETRSPSAVRLSIQSLMLTLVRGAPRAPLFHFLSAEGPGNLTASDFYSQGGAS